MAAVEILGPLSATVDASFHVHAAGCADIKRKPLYRNIRSERTWMFEATTLRALVEEIYYDFIFYNDEQPWEDYVNDVRVFPCVGNLPTT